MNVAPADWRARGQRLCEIEERPARQLLGSQLDEQDAGAEPVLKDLACVQSARRADVDVENRVEPRWSLGALSQRLALTGLLLRHVAFHEARAEAGGDEVGVVQNLQVKRNRRLDPSTTVISSVRFIRAMASERSRPYVMIFAMSES